MQPCSLLIADSDPAHLNLIVHRLRKQPKFKIVAAVCDGMDALAQIRTFRPDFVLMDMCLPKFDGTFILKELAQMRKRPEVICMAAVFSHFLLGIVKKYGAACCVYKPAAPEMIENLLLECVDYTEKAEKVAQADENSIALKIHDLLNGLGFSPRNNGTRYLADAVECAIQTGKRDVQSTKLYQQLSTQTDASPSQIERCIRIAIQSANKDFRLQTQLNEKPTNKAVIRYLIDAVHHWLDDQVQ